MFTIQHIEIRFKSFAFSFHEIIIIDSFYNKVYILLESIIAYIDTIGTGVFKYILS